MKNKLRGKITITRPSDLENDRKFRIRIQDNNSLQKFIDIEIDAEDLMLALAGEGNQPIEFSLEDCSVVGKIKQSKPLEFLLPEDKTGRCRKLLAENLADKNTDPGYTASKYFGSKTSFYTKDGNRYARTTQYRYVDPSSLSEADHIQITYPDNDDQNYYLIARGTQIFTKYGDSAIITRVLKDKKQVEFVTVEGRQDKIAYDRITQVFDKQPLIDPTEYLNKTK